MAQYLDRHGEWHTPKANDLVRPRKGGFVIIIFNDAVLVADGQHAPGVPELPGGGIEGDENALQAALRETWEETGFNIKDYGIKSTFEVQRHFYADDINEYWNYDITYFHLDLADNGIYFEGKRPSPEGGYVWWLPLKDIRSGAPFKEMERMSLKDMKLI